MNIREIDGDEAKVIIIGEPTNEDLRAFSEMFMEKQQDNEYEKNLADTIKSIVKLFRDAVYDKKIRSSDIRSVLEVVSPAYDDISGTFYVHKVREGLKKRWVPDVVNKVMKFLG